MIQTLTHRRPGPKEYPVRLALYMDQVPEADLVGALRKQAAETDSLIAGIPERLYDHRYAPDKWTVREVFGHILDTERIFGYRLLCFARGDESNLKRADPVLYVANA